MKKNGFTLVELLAVVVILAIVIVISMSSTTGLSKKMKENMLEKKQEVIEQAGIAYGNVHKAEILADSDKCIRIRVRKLVEEEFLDKDQDCEPTASDSKCVIDPSKKNTYLDAKYVKIYYKNERIKAAYNEAC